MVYHYSKCKKSRAGLEYLRNLGVDPLVVNYIEDGLDHEQLKELLCKLNLPAFEMVRQQEEYYKETLKHQDISEDQWIDILIENPRLLRRPIVIFNDGAVVADPPQNADKLLTAYIK